MKTALEIIAFERERQKEEEGYTAEQDDQYINNELALAAASYVLPDNIKPLSSFHEQKVGIFLSLKRWMFWPWSIKYFKPNPGHRIKELAKAGALIVAEIERIQRLQGFN